MSIIYRFLKSKRIEMMGIIITVDGPSGAGKGTLCYALAEKLGFTLLDSGAIYSRDSIGCTETSCRLNR